MKMSFTAEKNFDKGQFQSVSTELNFKVEILDLKHIVSHNVCTLNVINLSNYSGFLIIPWFEDPGWYIVPISLSFSDKGELWFNYLMLGYKRKLLCRYSPVSEISWAK